MEEYINEFTKQFWVYDYKLTYYNHFEEKTISYSGFVIAKSMDNAYAQLKRYYLEPEEEFDKILIEARDSESGEISKDLVIPFLSNETLIKIPEGGN